jgi:hypothetical protein
MTGPQPESEKSTGLRLFHGRRFGPLLGPWIACLIAAGVVYYFETQLPAFHVVVKPVYWILALIVVVTTVRALRQRSGSRRTAERRHRDRRHTG